MEQIVVMGLYDAFSEDRSITLNDFENAVKNTVPLSVTQAEQIISIRNWANVRAVAATAHKHQQILIIQNQKFQLLMMKLVILEVEEH